MQGLRGGKGKITKAQGEKRKMEDFGFLQMQRIQRELQEKYRGKWTPLSPETGQNSLLWLMIELGEVADIIKKKGSAKVMEDSSVRADFIEELADVLMYYNDVMLCFGISVEELKGIYLEKHRRNMERW